MRYTPYPLSDVGFVITFWIIFVVLESSFNLLKALLWPLVEKYRAAILWAVWRWA